MTDKARQVIAAPFEGTGATEAEASSMRLKARGNTYKRVAEILGIGEEAAKDRVKRGCAKLNIKPANLTEIYLLKIEAALD